MAENMKPNPTPEGLPDQNPTPQPEQKKPAEKEENQNFFDVESLEEVKKDAEKTRKQVKDFLKKEYNIDPEIIDKWKKQYSSIHVLFFDDEPYIVRGISRQEWKMINAKPIANRSEELSQEEAIANRTLLYPSQSLDVADPASAGLCSCIYQTVLRLSKFEPDIPPIRL